MRCQKLILVVLLLSGRAWGTAYYLSASGSDANNGLSAGAPWLSPNHALNCGDTITAAAGTYSPTAGNFSEGHWGTVSSCTFPSNEFATLQCATFAACVINATADFAGIWVDKSHWAVMGWQVSMGGSTTETSCFQATSNTSTGSNLSFILFANNVASGCFGAGFGVYSQNVASVYYSADYIAIVGNIAYNGAKGASACGSGISIYQPIKADSVAGTHIYVAGNFSYANQNSNPCDGTAPTDGEGIILDTLDGSQGGFALPYDQQTVVDNNIVFANGGRGIEVANNAAGSTHASIFIRFNTLYGDMTDLNQTFCTGNGDLQVYNAYTVQAYSNVSQANATGCGGNVVYAATMSSGNSTDQVYGDYLSGVGGNNTFLFSSGSFAYGPGNVVGTNPGYANAVNPGAPSCGAYASVPACMATVIADYTPTVAAAKAYGYHAPQTVSVTDALFPQWLCNAGLPSGLVTPGCGTAGVSTLGVGGTVAGGGLLVMQ